MFSRSASVRRVLGRRSMSFDTMFANKNHISEKRSKFYSNPTVGESLSLFSTNEDIFAATVFITIISIT
jgi:hypothetical protein